MTEATDRMETPRAEDVAALEERLARLTPEQHRAWLRAIGAAFVMRGARDLARLSVYYWTGKLPKRPQP